MLGKLSTVYNVCCGPPFLPVAIYSRFPDGDLPTLMDDVSCTGNETRLIDCAHKTREGSNCDRSEHVGLICGGVVNQVTSDIIMT